MILYAAGYDSDNNYIGDISINWGLTGQLNISDLSNQNGSSIIYSPVKSETEGKIFIYSQTLNKSDSTGVVKILDGLVADIQIMDGLGENADSLGIREISNLMKLNIFSFAFC